MAALTVTCLLDKAGRVAYLCGCIIDNFFRRQVALVSDKQLVHVLTRVPVDFLQPLLDVIERILETTNKQTEVTLVLMSAEGLTRSFSVMYVSVKNKFRV